MPKQDPEVSAVQAELVEAQEQLADAQVQIESLQSAAADAEARAATLRERTWRLEAELSTAREELAAARAELLELSSQDEPALSEQRTPSTESPSEGPAEADEAAEAESAASLPNGPAGRAELVEAREQLAESRAQLREAALKYREARLASVPQIPPDLVPGETVEEIDQQLEAAQQVVAQLRDKLRQETQGSRVPMGAPPRRSLDLSALSPTEKIKLGLERLAER